MAINYSKTTFVNGSSPPLNATNLNKMEQGIKDACDGVDSLDTTVTTMSGTVAQHTQDISDLGTNFNSFKLSFSDSNNDGNIVIAQGGA